MLATKTSNRGKLDSHCWFFDGFAYLLQPDFCVLFDAGTCRSARLCCSAPGLAGSMPREALLRTSRQLCYWALCGCEP